MGGPEGGHGDGREAGVHPGEEGVGADDPGRVEGLGAGRVLREGGQVHEGEADEGHQAADHEHAKLEKKLFFFFKKHFFGGESEDLESHPVVGLPPEDPAEAVEDLGGGVGGGEEVVVADVDLAVRLGVVVEQARAERDREEGEPQLGRERNISLICFNSELRRVGRNTL